MNRRNAVILAAAFLCCLVLVTGALAQGTTSIGWWVIGGGGGKASSSGVALDGTLAQPIIGLASHGSVSLDAGYWGGVVMMEYKLYLPVVLRGA